MIPDLAFYPFIAIVIVTSVVSSNSNLQNRLIQAGAIRLLSQAEHGFCNYWNWAALLFVVVFEMVPWGLLLSQLIAAIIFFFRAQYYLLPNLKGAFNQKYIFNALKYGGGILPHHLLGAAAPLFSKVYWPVMIL